MVHVLYSLALRITCITSRSASAKSPENAKPSDNGCLFFMKRVLLGMFRVRKTISDSKII